MLFQLPLPEEGKHLIPFRKQDRWNRDHVRLPCSPENTFRRSGDKDNTSRWELIKLSLSVQINSGIDLENAIKGYNATYERDWDFSTLRVLLDEHYDRDEKDFFFKKLLPAMINLALSLPDLVMSPIPLLQRGSSRSISMSQQQAACLLANAFFCTFPMRNTNNRNSDYSSYPKINFNRLFQSQGRNVIEKLKCIIHYFKRVLFDEMSKNVITFQRQFIGEPKWEESVIPIGNTKFHIQSDGRIEDAQGMLQVDFANRFVGGGVLSQGCVQEEIRFVISPELIVARLFTECLADNEALIVFGFERFSTYKGYAASFQFAGDFVDTTPLDCFRRKKSQLVAIDAIAYDLPQEQFDDAAVLRDANKAYAGFFCDDENNKAPIASGLWGCGAFNGDPVRSAIIQLIACAQSGRNLAFYTFRDQVLESTLADLFECFVVNKTTVAQLIKALKSYRYRGSSDDLVPYIKHRCESAKRAISTDCVGISVT